MTWFKYLNNNVNLRVPESFEYIQPSLKRELSLSAPRDYIYKNDWLFVDMGNNEINKIYNKSSLKEDQNHSYVIIYEYDNLDPTKLSSTPAPTKTTMVNNIVYFQAVKDHKENYQMDGKYSLYYGQDYLKYIHATPYVKDNETKYDYIAISKELAESYDDDQNTPRLYDATPSNINLYQTVLTAESKNYYTLAFFNDGIDWKNSVSQKPGAKALANFSGPNVDLHAITGPSNGKIRIRIVSKQQSASDIEKIALDWTEIDCFSLTEQEVVIFNKTNLEYKDYNLEIEVLEDKNTLSTGKSIEITKVSFLKNMYITFGEQLINDTLVFTSLGGIR
jgi:hypothetical protein